VPKPRCTHARRFFRPKYLYPGGFTVAMNSSPPFRHPFVDCGCEISSTFQTTHFNSRKTHPMLKLHAGVSRKVGLPGFSSASASCTIEAELDSSLLQDHEGFQIVVQRAYESCEKAVQDQIARLTYEDPSDASQPLEIVEVRTAPTITGASVNRIPTAQFSTQPSTRPATASQVKAIRAIAARRKVDLVGLLREKFGLTTADELGIRQASNLIDDLKSDEPTASPSTNGNGTYATTGGAR
jgi:hypothetical protein